MLFWLTIAQIRLHQMIVCRFFHEREWISDPPHWWCKTCFPEDLDDE